jgi:hypothetical protein
MKTITINAYNRPEDTGNTLSSLPQCRSLSAFDPFEICVDPGGDPVAKVCLDAGKRMPIETSGFFSAHADAKGRYAFLNLYHYQYRGEGRNKAGVLESLSLIAEISNLSSPFAWCVRRHRWPYIRRHLRNSTRSIGGWAVLCCS